MPVTLTSEIAECPVRLDSIVLEPELADVQISVSCDKETKLFHAHKLVLAVGSDVFKTMFFGSVPQPNPVVITDSTPAAFEAFLRFVYTGTTTVDEAEIFPMLNLAKKYLVGSLSKVLLNYVEESITSENVGQILLNGQNFLDDAPLRFWESVECHGEALLKSDEFLQLRKDTVQALLQREPEAEESLVYEKAVAWAKAECSRKKVELFKWFTAAIPQTIFPDIPRAQESTGESYVCDRLRYYGNNWNGSGSADAINFTVDRAVWVTGLGVYGPSLASGYHYTVGNAKLKITAKLLLGSAVLATKDESGMTASNAQPIPVIFDKGIKIQANKCYTASVVSSGPTYWGYNGISSKMVATKKGDVVFTFVPSNVTSNTSVAQGQIPQILFRA